MVITNIMIFCFCISGRAIARKENKPQAVKQLHVTHSTLSKALKAFSDCRAVLKHRRYALRHKSFL